MDLAGHHIAPPVQRRPEIATDRRAVRKGMMPSAMSDTIKNTHPGGDASGSASGDASRDATAGRGYLPDDRSGVAG
jgi:hypothetical protein